MQAQCGFSKVTKPRIEKRHPRARPRIHAKREISRRLQQPTQHTRPNALKRELPLKITDRKFLSSYEALFEKHKAELAKIEIKNVAGLIRWCANQGKPRVEEILKMFEET